ncbi:hypothetical protein [Sediminibacillus albus]|uniref:Uncharacterized protein n=1 Tax=Sediminibacillus albus TaxID=407036 RepID=A0A1G8WTJ5_9BACI|nr:hypothetical protein [Sediminibacillus albus]SDJ80935.1 hypothetical protein SAMN05216243_0959 [Sediminibacillus albus]
MEILAFLIFLLVYIGLPLTIIFLLKWIYEIKNNSELQVEQNYKIIDLLERISKTKE